MTKTNRTGWIAVLCAALFTAATAVGAQPTKSYKNPETGEDCVTNQETTESSTGYYVTVFFRNSCDISFRIWGELKDKKYSTVISARKGNADGTAHHTVIPANAIGDFRWWVE